MANGVKEPLLASFVDVLCRDLKNLREVVFGIRPRKLSSIRCAENAHLPGRIDILGTGAISIYLNCFASSKSCHLSRSSTCVRCGKLTSPCSVRPRTSTEWKVVVDFFYGEHHPELEQSDDLFTNESIADRLSEYRQKSSDLRVAVGVPSRRIPFPHCDTT